MKAEAHLLVYRHRGNRLNRQRGILLKPQTLWSKLYGGNEPATDRRLPTEETGVKVMVSLLSSAFAEICNVKTVPSAPVAWIVPPATAEIPCVTACELSMVVVTLNGFGGS